jgi:N-acetylneuraminic acid mutarotase
VAFGNGSVLSCCLLVAACSGGETKSQQPDGAGAGGGGATAGNGGSGTGAGGSGVSGGAAGSGTSGGGTGAEAGSSSGGSAGTGDGGTSGGGAGSPSGGSSGAGNGGAGGAAGSAGGTPREEELPDLTTVRQEHAVVALAGEIYVVGGYTPNATATVEAYDPAARSWRPIRDLPQALNHANAAAVGNALYVTGFYVGSSMSNTSRQVYSYNPTANEWTEREPMPDGTQRATGCVAVLGNKIYVFGGSRGMTVTDASAYDTVGNTWEPLPALAESREHCTAGAIEGIIYIASGRTGGITGFRPSTVAFDPGTMMYSPKAPITTPRGGAAGAVLNGRLFVFGGEGNPASGTNGVFPNIEAYDPVSNAWETLPPMQIPRHGYGAATLDGRIYLAGGATRQGLGAVNDNSAFYYE